jgi:hypothetical protein
LFCSVTGGGVLLGGFLAGDPGFVLGEFMPGDAAADRTENGMVMGVMAGDATYHGTFEAAFGLGLGETADRQNGEGGGEGRADERHVMAPVLRDR